jgi:HAD superfamily hydrolase (TIGR01662 family)
VEQLLRPGVFDKIAELRAAGHKIALASDQTSVAKGIMTLEQAQALMENCAVKIGGADAWRMSPFDPNAKKKIKGKPNPYARDDPSHKPHPGMIRDLMNTFDCAPEDVIMVGDAKLDKQAAQAAGVLFIGAKEFFKSGRGG